MHSPARLLLLRLLPRAQRARTRSRRAQGCVADGRRNCLAQAVRFRADARPCHPNIKIGLDTPQVETAPKTAACTSVAGLVAAPWSHPRLTVREA